MLLLLQKQKPEILFSLWAASRAASVAVAVAVSISTISVAVSVFVFPRSLSISVSRSLDGAASQYFFSILRLCERHAKVLL